MTPSVRQAFILLVRFYSPTTLTHSPRPPQDVNQSLSTTTRPKTSLFNHTKCTASRSPPSVKISVHSSDTTFANLPRTAHDLRMLLYLRSFKVPSSFLLRHHPHTLALSPNSKRQVTNLIHPPPKDQVQKQKICTVTNYNNEMNSAKWRSVVWEWSLANIVTGGEGGLGGWDSRVSPLDRTGSAVSQRSPHPIKSNPHENQLGRGASSFLSFLPSNLRPLVMRSSSQQRAISSFVRFIKNRGRKGWGSRQGECGDKETRRSQPSGRFIVRSVFRGAGRGGKKERASALRGGTGGTGREGGGAEIDGAAAAREVKEQKYNSNSNNRRQGHGVVDRDPAGLARRPSVRQKKQWEGGARSAHKNKHPSIRRGSKRQSGVGQVQASQLRASLVRSSINEIKTRCKTASARQKRCSTLRGPTEYSASKVSATRGTRGWDG
ncbi:hypothetical protein R3P38DRAFT_3339276 [Favolaschia claudopus]|uniref:Uncharacterized protein n=1 Tax=Favolaschia claudopus TaxID=2862362 RepID=A0AAW0EID3_9AGAR